MKNWQNLLPCIYCSSSIVKEGVSIRRLSCIPNSVLVFLGFLLGTISALVWNGGYIDFVREMIPYALALAIILFVFTAVLKARCGNTQEFPCLTSTCASLRKYSPIVIICAVIFIVFSLIVLATFLSHTIRFVLAFIGSISFWTMLLEFTAMISCILYRR